MALDISKKETKNIGRYTPHIAYRNTPDFTEKNRHRVHGMATGLPDLRQEYYGLSVGISGDWRHQDNLTDRDILQGRKCALRESK